MTDSIKCAIYARYSSDMQKETSIEDQISNCRAFAAVRQWNILEDYIYFDKALSGTSLIPRDNFNELLGVALSGEAPFQYILVDDTSRVARNTRDALRIFEELTFKNIFIYYITQGIDTQKEIAFEMITLHGMVDALYVKELAKKVLRGHEGQFRRGFNTGNKPYGYRSIPVMGNEVDRYGNSVPAGYKHVIDPEQAKTVVNIFELYALKRYSYVKIMNWLNKSLLETGSPKPPKSRLWTITTIAGRKKENRGILNNPIYVGKKIWNMVRTKRNPINGKITRIMNAPEMWVTRDAPELRIISDDLWEKTRIRQKEVIDRTGGKFTKAKAFYAQHLLTGITFCGECGKPFSIVTAGSVKGYGCTGHKRLGNYGCKNDVQLRFKFFEESVISILNDFCLNQGRLNNLIKEISINVSSYLIKLRQSAGKAELLRQIEQTRTEIANISRAISLGIVTNTTKNILLKAEQQERDLLNQMSLAQADKMPIPSNLISYDDVQPYFKNVSIRLLNPDIIKEALFSVVDKIIVKKDDSEIIIEVHEKKEETVTYINNLINTRLLGIRLELGSQFQPYSRRVITYKLLEFGGRGKGQKKRYTIIR